MVCSSAGNKFLKQNKTFKLVRRKTKKTKQEKKLKFCYRIFYNLYMKKKIECTASWFHFFLQKKGRKNMVPTRSHHSTLWTWTWMWTGKKSVFCFQSNFKNFKVTTLLTNKNEKIFSMIFWKTFENKEKLTVSLRRETYFLSSQSESQSGPNSI